MGAIGSKSSWLDGIMLDNSMKMKMKEKAPVAYCVHTKKILFIASVIFKKVVHVWEVLDEQEDEMLEQLTRDSDHCIWNIWGLHLKHTYAKYVTYFAKMGRIEMQLEERGKLDVTPTGRAALLQITLKVSIQNYSLC